MNYPAGSNTPTAPWNQHEPDEPRHQRQCGNCRRFLKASGWELEDEGNHRHHEWVWFTRCRSCGQINVHGAEAGFTG